MTVSYSVASLVYAVLLSALITHSVVAAETIASSRRFHSTASTKALCDFSSSDFFVSFAPTDIQQPDYTRTVYWISNSRTVADCRTPIGTRLVVSLSVLMRATPSDSISIRFHNVDFEASSLVFLTEENLDNSTHSNFPSGVTLIDEEQLKSKKLNITVTGCFFDGREQTVAGVSVSHETGPGAYRADNTWRTAQLLLVGKVYPVATSVLIKSNTLILNGTNYTYPIIPSREPVTIPRNLTTYEEIAVHSLRFGAFSFTLGRFAEDDLNISLPLTPIHSPPSSSFMIVQNRISVCLRLINYTTPADQFQSLPTHLVEAFGLNRVAFINGNMKVLIAGNTFNASSIRINATTTQPTTALPAMDDAFEIDTISVSLFTLYLGYGVELLFINNNVFTTSHDPYGGSMYGIWFSDALWLSEYNIIRFEENVFQLNASLTSPCELMAIHIHNNYLQSGYSLFSSFSRNKFFISMPAVTITQWPVDVSAITHDDMPGAGNVTRLFTDNTLNLTATFNQIVLDRKALSFTKSNPTFILSFLRLFPALHIGQSTLAVLNNVANITAQLAAPAGPTVSMNAPLQVNSRLWKVYPLMLVFLYSNGQQIIMNFTKHVVLGNEMNTNLKLIDAPLSWTSSPPASPYTPTPPEYSVHFILIWSFLTLLNAFAAEFDIGDDIAYIIDRNYLQATITSEVSRLVPSGIGGMRPNQPLTVSLVGSSRSMIGTYATNSVMAFGCISSNRSVDYPYLGLSNLLAFGHSDFVNEQIQRIRSKSAFCGNSATVVINNAAPSLSSSALQPFNITCGVFTSVYDDRLNSITYFTTKGDTGKLIIAGNTMRFILMSTNASSILTTTPSNLPVTVTSISNAEASVISREIESQRPPIPSTLTIFSSNATRFQPKQMGMFAIIGNTLEVSRVAFIAQLRGQAALVPVAWYGYEAATVSTPPLALSVFRNRMSLPYDEWNGFDLDTMGYVSIKENTIRLVDAAAVVSITSTTAGGPTATTPTTTTFAPLPSASAQFPLLVIYSLLDTDTAGVSLGKVGSAPSSYGLIEMDANKVEVPLIAEGRGLQPLTVGGSVPIPTDALAFSPTNTVPLPISLIVMHYSAWRASLPFPALSVYLTISFCSNIVNTRYLHVSEFTSFPLSASQLASTRIGLGGAGGLVAAMRQGLLKPSLIDASSSTNAALVGCPLPVAPTVSIPIVKGTEVIVGSVGVISVVSGQVTAMNAMLRLAKCDGEEGISGGGSSTLDEELDDDGGMGMAAHPLRFAIGSGKYSIYRGAIIGNLIVFPIIIALIVRFAMGPVVSFWATQDRSIATALRTVGWPSAAFLPYVSLAEGTGKSVSLLYQSGAGEDVAIAVLGTIIIGVAFALWGLILVQFIPAKMIELRRSKFVSRMARRGLTEGEDFETRELKYKVPCMGSVTKHGFKQRILSVRWWFTPFMEWEPIVQVGHISIGFRGMGRGHRDTTTDAEQTYLDTKEASLVAPELSNADPLLYNERTSSSAGTNSSMGTGSSGSTKSSVTASDLSLDITGKLTKTNIEYQIESFAHIIGDRKLLATELVVFMCTFGVGVIEGLPSHWCRSRVMLAFIAIMIQIGCDIVNLIPIVWATQMFMNVAVFSLSIVAISQVFEGGEASKDTEDALEELGTLGNVIGIFAIFLSLASTIFRARRMYRRSVMEMRGNDSTLPNNSFIGGVDMQDLPTRPAMDSIEVGPPPGTPPPAPGVEEDLLLDSSDDSVNSDYGLDIDAEIESARRPNPREEKTPEEPPADPYVGVIRLNSATAGPPVEREETFVSSVLRSVETAIYDADL